MLKAKCHNCGFSLLEILIVISIIVILATVGSGFYLNYAKNVEINSTAQNIIADMKHMQSKAMSGEGEIKWGVHIVNGNSDYYELFSTPTTYANPATSIQNTVYLPASIVFSDPISGESKDIIFNKISGTTTATVIILESSGLSKIITISSIGTIY